MTDSKCDIRKRLDSLRSERESWESQWEQLSLFIAPKRYRRDIHKHNEGNRERSKIIDNTASRALRVMASGMMAGVTSPSRPWFRLSAPDPELNQYQPVKQWLHDVQKRMQEQFSRSNLYNVLPTAYADLGCFGTAAVSELEDDEDVFRFYTFPVASYALGMSSRRTVDSFCYQLRMTVGQIVDQFGLEGASQAVKSAWQSRNIDQLIDVDVLIQPNKYMRSDSPLAKDFPWSAHFIDRGADKGKYLLQSGYQEFPIFAPRWEPIGNDVYGGDCPGMLALGDVRALQKEQSKKLMAIDKAVDPPMLAPSTMKQKLRSGKGLLPGGVVYEDLPYGMQGVRPAYEMRFDTSGVIEDIRETQERINDSFFVNLFLMLSMADRGQMTAREVQERHEEKLLMLGPVLERIHEELLDPLIDRSFSIMMRRGLLPPPPKELENIDLKVEYISILAQAQKMLGSASIDRIVGFAGNLVEVWPEARDKIDTDKAIDEYAENLGVPPEIIRGERDVAAIRQGRAKQQAQAEQAAQAQELVQGAKTLSETNTEGKNGLTDLVRQMQGGVA